LEQCAEPLAQYTLPYNYGDQAVVTFFLVKSTDSQGHFTADIFPGSPSHLQCINGITVRYLLLGLITFRFQAFHCRSCRIVRLEPNLFLHIQSRILIILRSIQLSFLEINPICFSRILPTVKSLSLSLHRSKNHAPVPTANFHI